MKQTTPEGRKGCQYPCHSRGEVSRSFSSPFSSHSRARVSPTVSPRISPGPLPSNSDYTSTFQGSDHASLSSTAPEPQHISPRTGSPFSAFLAAATRSSASTLIRRRRSSGSVSPSSSIGHRSSRSASPSSSFNNPVAQSHKHGITNVSIIGAYHLFAIWTRINQEGKHVKSRVIPTCNLYRPHCRKAIIVTFLVSTCNISRWSNINLVGRFTTSPKAAFHIFSITSI